MAIPPVRMQPLHDSIVSLWQPITLNRGVFSLPDRTLEKRAIVCDRGFVKTMRAEEFLR